MHYAYEIKNDKVVSILLLNKEKQEFQKSLDKTRAQLESANEELNEELKKTAAAGEADWPSTFSPRVSWCRHPFR